jgi:hypothetical protein
MIRYSTLNWSTISLSPVSARRIPEQLVDGFARALDLLPDITVSNLGQSGIFRPRARNLMKREIITTLHANSGTLHRPRKGVLMTHIEVPNYSSRRSVGGRIMRSLVLLVLLAAVALALWTWLTLSWAYSEGERAGVLQKFSRKGWICKTREGEVAQFVVAGVSPQIWLFSVRDDAVAAQLDKAVGHHIQLHYTEHRGIPTSCFAETSYFVDRVTEETDTSQAPAAASPPAAPVPATAPAAAAPVPAVPTPAAPKP